MNCKMHIYAANANEVRIPEDDALRHLLDCNRGNICYLDKRGTPFAKYLNYIEELSMYAYERNGKLKIAPPYGAWLKSGKGA